MITLFALGFCTGLRCMTPIAVICWFAWLGLLPVHGTWAFWSGNLIAVIVFTLCALGEYVGDTLPRTPNRTAAGPAIARVIFGGLVGAIAATSTMEPLAGGILFGVLGAVAGTWGGFYARRFFSRKLGKDLPVAIAESAFTLAVAVLACHLRAHELLKHASVHILLLSR